MAASFKAVEAKSCLLRNVPTAPEIKEGPKNFIGKGLKKTFKTFKARKITWIGQSKRFALEDKALTAIILKS